MFLGKYPPFKTDSNGNILVSISGGIPASTITITNDTTTNATVFPTWVSANTGELPLKVSSTKITFNPSTGTLTSINMITTNMTMSGVLNTPQIKNYSETVATVTAGATTTIDITAGNVVNMSQATDITTFNFNNPSTTGTCCSFTLIRTKDNSATARAIAWPASVDWSNNGTPPMLSTNANAVDIFTFFTINAGTTWFGFTAGLDMA